MLWPLLQGELVHMIEALLGSYCTLHSHQYLSVLSGIHYCNRECSAGFTYKPGPFHSSGS